jgi:hypothetical protein
VVEGRKRTAQSGWPEKFWPRAALAAVRRRMVVFIVSGFGIRAWNWLGVEFD